MCTVTFVAQRNGYCLGMNRDEKLARVAGLPPERRRVNGRDVIFPSEPGGGTWIALNDGGVCFALINWNSVADRVKQRPISRGEVVTSIAGSDSSTSAGERIQALPLGRVNPFRLIGVFPAHREIIEWRWNLRQLTVEYCPWRTQQWISSSFDECTAQELRSSTFRQRLAESAAPGLRWLRKLHQSHSPEAGPFSTCVHRADAATVSFTEVHVKAREAVMRYRPGYPCSRSPNPVCELKLQLLRSLCLGEAFGRQPSAALAFGKLRPGTVQPELRGRERVGPRGGPACGRTAFEPLCD